MKHLKHILPFLLIAVALGTTSCKKKCIIEAEDTNNGSIVPEVVFYPESGYMTSSMAGNYVIGATHPYADNFMVSINGSGKVPVNFGNYKILCYPVTANCSAAYDRTVTIDNTAQTVVYKIVATQCSECEEKRVTENYVLVPTFPDTYTVSYDISYIDK